MHATYHREGGVGAHAGSACPHLTPCYVCGSKLSGLDLPLTFSMLSMPACTSAVSHARGCGQHGCVQMHMSCAASCTSPSSAEMAGGPLPASSRLASLLPGHSPAARSSAPSRCSLWTTTLSTRLLPPRLCAAIGGKWLRPWTAFKPWSTCRQQSCCQTWFCWT